MIKRKNKAILCAMASIALINTSLPYSVNAMNNENSTIIQTRNITNMKVYNTPSLNIRKGPGTKYAKIGTVYNNNILEVIEISNGWAKINYKNGIGYCSAKYLKTVSSSSSSTKKEMEVKVDDLSVRSGAGTTYKKLGSLNKGTKVTVISTLSNGWVKIEYKNGYGYVSNVKGAYLEAVSSSNPSVPNEPSIPDVPSTPDTTPSTKKEMQVKVDDLSVRSGAGTTYKKLGSLDKGTKVTVISTLSNGWVKIEYKNGYGYVSNVKGAYLEEVESSQEKADKVIAMINALNDNITLDDYDDVMEAKKAYEDLSKEEQDLVKNSSKLTDILDKIEELEGLEIDKYNAIIEIIRTFEEKVTVTNVVEERAKFNRIVEIAKTMHWSEAQNLPQSIEDKKNEIEEIEKQIENARRVTDMIKELEGKDIELSDKDKVVTTREAYDTLTQEEKNLVVNENILVEAEQKINLLENPASPDAVKTMIDDLNKAIDITDEDDVKNARIAYDSLTPEQQNLVGDITVLENAESQIQTIIDKIDNVLDLISDLPIEIKIEHRQQVMDVKTAFENLSSNEQKKIAFTDKAILESAIAKISSLDKIEADRVIVANLINRINDLQGKKINLEEHEEEIKDIRAKYNALEYVRQDEVTNYEEFRLIELDLTHIYEDIIHLEWLIDELPDVIENVHIAKVEQAKKEYEDLTSKNKCGVKQDLVEKLNNAIAQSEALKQTTLNTIPEVKAVDEEI